MSRARPPWAVAVAALAAELAVVVAPAARVELPWTLWTAAVALVAPLMLTIGLVTARPWPLLAGVPVGLGLMAWPLPIGAWTPSLSGAALGAVGAYLIVTLRWLATGPEAADWPWRRMDDEPLAAPDLLPWAAGLMVAGPAVVVALMGPLEARLLKGYPGSPGLARVGLALLGTLVGLAIATDLVRGRPARRGRPGRAIFHAITAALCLGAVAALHLAGS